MFEDDFKAGIAYTNQMIQREGLPYTHYSVNGYISTVNRVIFTGIGQLIQEGHTTTDIQEFGALPATALVKAESTLEQLSLRMGSYTNIKAAHFGEFPGRVYIALQASSPVVTPTPTPVDPSLKCMTQEDYANLKYGLGFLNTNLKQSIEKLQEQQRTVEALLKLPFK